MPRPIVIAHHLIWTAYGWWLPNDPRGSGSHHVASDIIATLGTLHHGRKRVQPAGHEVRAFFDRSRDLLKHKRRVFDRADRDTLGDAFGEVVREHKYTCYACAVMPDHVHILIRKHKHPAERMMESLQSASRAAIVETDRWPSDHPVWTGGGGWTVYLDHPDDVQRTIRYIERNPSEINLPPQRWAFVMAYDGWPLHPGHNPNSPYAKRLRAAGRYPDAEC